ncbi:MAG: DUF748 domain-containing protein [Gemmataceae bacterium]
MSNIAPIRRRRWPYVILFLLGLLLALGWFAPSIIANSTLKQRVIQMASADLKGQIHIDSLTLGWLRPVEIRGLTLVDESDVEVARVERVVTSKTLLDLIRNHVQLGVIDVESPQVNAVCQKDSSNIETVLAKYFEPSSSQKPRPTITVRIHDGTVTLRDDRSPLVQRIEQVNGEVQLPADGEPIAISLTSQLPESKGSLDITGKFGEKGQLKVDTTELPLEPVSWIARRFEPGLIMRGHASGHVELAIDGKTVNIEGKLNARDLELANERRGGELFASGMVEIPVSLTFNDSVLTSRNCQLTCDAGKASFAGTIDLAKTPDHWLSQPGLKINVDLHAEKLPKLLPSIRQSLAGTQIQSGAITLAIASKENPKGTTWDGSFDISTIRAVRDGKTIVWDTPVKAEFAGRVGTDGYPTFDKLQVASDFIGLNFRGSWDQFEMAAILDLDRLTAHLSDFADLRGMTLTGRANLTAWNRPGDKGTMSLLAKATVDRFAIADGRSFSWHEPSLAIEANANSKREANGAIRVDRGSAKLTAAGDTATLELTDSIPDLRTWDAGGGNVSLAGDIGRWRSRLATFVTLPTELQTAGSVQANARVSFSPRGFVAENTDLTWKQCVVRGMGLILNEPQLTAKVGATEWRWQSGDLMLKNGRCVCEMLQADFDALAVKPNAGTLPGLEGTIAIAACRLNRLAPMLGLSSDPRNPQSIDGLAKGTVTLKPDAGQGSLGWELKVSAESFRYGPSQRPLWAEPRVDLTSAGHLDFSQNLLALDAVRLAVDGLEVNGKGSISRLTRDMNLDLAGTLSYDLARIEPQVKGYLGRNGKLVGKDTKPFRVSGPLYAAMDQLAANANAGPSLARISGEATVGWQSMRAFGFDVGRADLVSTVNHGHASFLPVRTSFEGGRIDVTPSLSLTSSQYNLSFSKGRIIENARLTPAACTDAVGYALPAIANSTEAEGLISVDWDEGQIPLMDPTKMKAKGKLVMHSVKVTPGPVIREILTMSGMSNTTFALANEETVPIRVENGRIYHQDFRIGAKNYSVRTRGSVGFDGSLDLTCEVPIPPQLLDQVFKNNASLRETMSKRTIPVPFGGTINRPVVDARAFQANVQKLVSEAAKDAIKDAAGDLLKKQLNQGLEKLLPKIP